MRCYIKSSSLAVFCLLLSLSLANSGCKIFRKEVASAPESFQSTTEAFANVQGPMPFEIRVLNKGYLAAAEVPDGVGVGGAVPPLTQVRRVRATADFLDRWYAAPVEEVTVSSMDEYFRVSQEALPDLGGFEREFEELERAAPKRRAVAVPSPGNEALAREIVAYEKSVRDALREASKDPKVPPYVTRMLEGLDRSGASFEDLRKVGGPLWGYGKLLDDEMILTSVKAFGSSVEATFASVRSEAARVAAAGDAPQGREFKKVVEALFSRYLELMSGRAKKTFLSNIVDDPRLLRTPESKAALLIDNSGPMFKKFLQMLARDPNLDPAFRRLLEIQESDGRAMPWALVERLIAQDAEKLDILSIEQRHLAAGSMAQVHKAKIKDPVTGQPREVVVRVVNVDAERMVKEDRAIFAIIAPEIDAMPERAAINAPKLSNVIDELNDNIVAELDVEATAQRQMKARAVYSKTMKVRKMNPLNVGKIPDEVEFRVPALYRSNPQSKLLVQELVEGGKATTLTARELSAAGDSLADLYLSEAIFGGGFFHGDPHFGNVIVKSEGKKLVVNLLDYGMGGTLTSAQRQGFVRLAIGTFFLDEDLVVDELWKLSVKERNKIGLDELRANVRILLWDHRGTLKPLQVSELLSFAVENGVKVPADFVGFARGQKALVQMLKAAGRDGDALQALLTKLGLKNARTLVASWLGRYGDELAAAAERSAAAAR